MCRLSEIYLKKMCYEKSLIEIVKFFCCAIFCVVIFSCDKTDVRPDYAAPMQYSPVQPYYQQNYQPNPQYYRNPYNYPPQNYYQYYDYDQYYVPPRAYQGREENYRGRSSIYSPNVTRSVEKY